MAVTRIEEGGLGTDSFNLPVTLNGTDGSSTDAGDNIVLDASASGVDAGERLLYEGIPPAPTIELTSITTSSISPSSADGATIGTSSAEWSDLYLADSSVIYFGNDQEITLTHSADSGLLLKHTATADDKPINLVLQTGETDMAANDVIGKISFQAPDEGTGTDAILVSAAIQARAEGDHSSSSNATSIDFMTGASEAATKKWSITSAGSFLNAGTNTIDMNAGELILDANGNTSITADTDDQIDFKIGGTDQLVIGAQEMTWKAAGSPGFVVQDTTTPTTFKMTTNDSSGFINTTTNHPIEIRTNNTASMTIGAAGDIDVERGDIFFSTGGKGICLGVTSNTDSNTLDDYEEGTFTPSAASNFSGTVDQAEGYYTKIGNVVTVWAHVRLSATSDGSSCSFDGLPFNSTSYTYMHHALSQGYHFSDVVALYPQVSGGNNEVFWYTTGTGSAGDVVTYDEMGTNANVINTSVGGVYKT